MALQEEIKSAEYMLGRLRRELRNPPTKRRAVKVVEADILEHETAIRNGKNWLKFIGGRFIEPPPDPPLTWPENVDNL